MEELQGRKDIKNLDIFICRPFSGKNPSAKGGCNDADPMWIGGKIYFISDRNGEFNLFSYDVSTKEIKALTSITKISLILKATAGNRQDNF